MAKASVNPFYPTRWTALTWLAVLLWAWHPFTLNFPPSESYAVDSVTGELSQPTRYHSLSELPFPVGWPLYYVKPSYLTPPAVVSWIAGAPIPPPGPSSVHPFAMVTNLLLVVIAITSLVYFLQRTTFRFTLLLLFAVVSAVPLYFALGRFITMFAGYEAARWYSIAVYFSPIPAALAIKFSIFQRVNWACFPKIGTRCQQSFDSYANADDAIAAASRLEMRGDWIASIDLYRRAAERWPQHATYNQNCIDRVSQKQSLAKP